MRFSNAETVTEEQIAALHAINEGRVFCRNYVKNYPAKIFGHKQAIIRHLARQLLAELPPKKPFHDRTFFRLTPRGKKALESVQKG